MFFFPCPRRKGRHRKTIGSCQRVKIWYAFDNFWLYVIYVHSSLACLLVLQSLSHIPPRFWCSMTPVPVRRVRAHACAGGNWACCYELWEIMGCNEMYIIFDIFGKPWIWIWMESLVLRSLAINGDAQHMYEYIYIYTIVCMLSTYMIYIYITHLFIYIYRCVSCVYTMHTAYCTVWDWLCFEDNFDMSFFAFHGRFCTHNRGKWILLEYHWSPLLAWHWKLWTTYRSWSIPIVCVRF